MFGSWFFWMSLLTIKNYHHNVIFKFITQVVFYLLFNPGQQWTFFNNEFQINLSCIVYVYYCTGAVNLSWGFRWGIVSNIKLQSVHLTSMMMLVIGSSNFSALDPLSFNVTELSICLDLMISYSLLPLSLYFCIHTQGILQYYWELKKKRHELKTTCSNVILCPFFCLFSYCKLKISYVDNWQNISYINKYFYTCS